MKEIEYIDGRLYTAEAQTSDTLALCVFFVDIGFLLAETRKMSHSLQLNYFRFSKKQFVFWSFDVNVTCNNFSSNNAMYLKPAFDFQHLLLPLAMNSITIHI